MLYTKNICFAYIIGIMLCSFGCRRNIVMGMNELNYSHTERGRFDNTLRDGVPNALELANANATTEPKGAIVLLHGLMSDADELNFIEKSFLEKYGNSVLVIKPECRVGRTSVIQSIEKQAKNVFHAIEKSLKSYNKQAIDFPLIIIGYSQGGVVGLTLANHYADQLKIHGMVAMNSPIMGVQALNCRTRDVKRFMSNGKKGLQIIQEDLLKKYLQYQIGIEPPKGIKHIHAGLWVSSFALKFLNISPLHGLRGICPNSEAVCNVQKFLQQGHNRIPCLLIGTYQDDFGKLFGDEYSDSADIQTLNSAFNEFITGTSSGKHDTLIPLSSQLCRGPSFNDLAIDSMGTTDFCSPKLPGVECKVHKGLIHAANLVAIHDNLFVMNESIDVVMNSKHVLEDLDEFVSTKLNLY